MPLPDACPAQPRPCARQALDDLFAPTGHLKAVAPRRRAAPAADLSTVRSAAAKTRWVGEGTREEGRVVHEAAEVDGKRISVGGWASLQPFVADHTSKDLQLVEVEALWAVGGAKMCRVRRLWRPAETFAGGVLDGALKEGVLIPDSCPQELPLHELKAPVDGAASGLHTGEWRYSPKWASYTKVAPPPSRKRSAAQSAAKRDQPASASGEVCAAPDAGLKRRRLPAAWPRHPHKPIPGAVEACRV